MTEYPQAKLADKEETVLETIAYQLEKETGRQSELLKQIQEKLHLIHDLNTGEKEQLHPIPEENTNDWKGNIRKIGRQITSNTESMEKILKHFNKII